MNKSGTCYDTIVVKTVLAAFWSEKIESYSEQNQYLWMLNF